MSAKPAWECLWPRGCPQPIGLVAGRDTKVCEYHAKIVSGLIGMDQPRLRRLSPADVLSDEQLDLAQILRKLGATPEAVRRALTRDQHPEYKATKGRGVLPQLSLGAVG